MLVGIVLWEAGIFSFGGIITSYSGFSKLKPQLAQTDIQGSGKMQLVMLNSVGNPITINLATVRVNDGSPKSATPPSGSIRSGELFLLNFPNAGAGLKDGDPATVVVTITYGITMGGIVVSGKQETGTIKLRVSGEATCNPACEVDWEEFGPRICVAGTCKQIGLCAEGRYLCGDIEFGGICCELTETCVTDGGGKWFMLRYSNSNSLQGDGFRWRVRGML
jgi:hypothetical protein